MPISQELMVATDSPRSLAIFFRGILLFLRHALNAVAKLARMSQWEFDFVGTTEDYARSDTEGKGLI